MDRIARVVEPSIGYRHQFPEPGVDPTVGQAMSNATCDLAETLGARAIIVPTSTGRTASRVARLRPHQPIIAITSNRQAISQLALEWGVLPVYVPECADVEELWSRSLDAARDSGLVEPGDLIVITAGTAVNTPGTTNLIKVDYT
jgi:pyruvate kinase